MPDRAPLQIRQFVLDAADLEGVAHFWSTLLGWPMRHWPEEDWISISDGSTTLCIQGAADHRPPRWGDPDRPQQAHLDIVVPDIDEAEALVLELGGEKLLERDDADPAFRVYADPAGHPFCLEFGID